jgi:hypothetical protein
VVAAVVAAAALDVAVAADVADVAVLLCQAAIFV